MYRGFSSTFGRTFRTQFNQRTSQFSQQCRFNSTQTTSTAQAEFTTSTSRTQQSGRSTTRNTQQNTSSSTRTQSTTNGGQQQQQQQQQQTRTQNNQHNNRKQQRQDEVINTNKGRFGQFAASQAGRNALAMTTKYTSLLAGISLEALMLSGALDKDDG
jgi:hypothetical protein